MPKKRALLAGAAIIALTIALSGCGPQPGATPNSAAQTASSAAADKNLITSPQQLKSIDVNTAKGRNEIDSQIDKNLNNLDKSLDALDKSMGKL